MLNLICLLILPECALGCIWDVFEMLWGCFGDASGCFGMHWGCIEDAFEMLWGCFRDAFGDALGMHLGNIVCKSFVHSPKNSSYCCGIYFWFLMAHLMWLGYLLSLDLGTGFV